MNKLHERERERERERESKRRAPILFISLTAITAGLLIAVGVTAWTSPSTNPPGGGGALNYFNGNIGVGTSTPGYPLTVAGVIYSSTGGFRFPDDTTQTTAASAGLGGGGTINYVGKFTGTGTIGNSVIFDNGTNVGIGTSTPASKLEVSGEIKIASTGTGCGSANEGAIRYNSSSKRFQGCDGIAWKLFQLESYTKLIPGDTSITVEIDGVKAKCSAWSGNYCTMAYIDPTNASWFTPTDNNLKNKWYMLQNLESYGAPGYSWFCYYAANRNAAGSYSGGQVVASVGTSFGWIQSTSWTGQTCNDATTYCRSVGTVSNQTAGMYFEINRNNVNYQSTSITCSGW